MKPDHIRERKHTQQYAPMVALLGATLASVLGSCAMPGRGPAPAPAGGFAAEPSYREHETSKKLKINEPQTIAAWEARIQRQGSTLYTWAPGGGGPPPPPPPPAEPPTPGPPPATPTPATRPSRRQSVRRYPTRANRRATAGASGGTSANARQSLRCRRICRTVRAICYAARRICQIAARIGGQSAQAACKRNQKTCRSARAISTLQGCVACGHAKRSRKKQTRRACLNGR